MLHHDPLLAASDAGLFYFLAVIVLFAIGWVAERAKSRMSGMGGPRSTPRPGRGAMPPMKRPEIPPLRRDVPAGSAPRPRPASRPPVPPSVPRPAPPVPGQRPAPVGPRTIEERKVIILGESPRPVKPGLPAGSEVARTVPAAPRPRKPSRAPAPPRPPAVPVAAEDDEDAPRNRLAQMAREIEARSQSRPLTRLQPLHATESAGPRPTSTAGSFRNLGVADLQRALILKEILEPPLSLRDV